MKRIVLLSALVAAPELAAQRANATVRAKPDAVPAAACCGIIKWAGRYDKMATGPGIVGMQSGQPVYQDAQGQLFQLNQSTGDLVYLRGVPRGVAKWSPVKFGGAVQILGMDAEGHQIHQNGRGEKFYLAPETGDMVFVKQ